MRRFALAWIAPVVAIAAVAIWPLVTGARTLFLRDVLNTHLGLRAFLADSIRAFELPLVDPLRAGGQGLVGNPNALALYPDNVLLLFTSTLWQLNAHFWLHGAVALAAMYALGRAWGLGREGAFAAATVYAFSGFFLAQMNLYNGVAGAAWAPALAAALLAARGERRRGLALAALGAVWALALLGGDPILAAIGLATALALALPVRRQVPWRGALAALAAGALVALPQYVEMLRLLPGSFRGFLGHGALAQARAMPDPRALLELVVPFFFGRPDRLDLWGTAYFGGAPALYYSLAPGLLALAAVAVGARRSEPRTRVAFVVLVVATAIGFSGGGFGALLGALPGGGLFRFDVKLVLGAALAGSLLAGRGLERLLDEPRARAQWARAVALLAGIELALFLLFALGHGPIAGLFRDLFAAGLSDAELARHRVGWAALCLLQLAVLAAGLVLGRVVAARTALGVAAVVVLHAGSQMLLTRPMLPTDDAARYRQPPALLDRIPADAVLAHGGFYPFFGGDYASDAAYPERRAYEFARRAQRELFSFPALLAGRRLELDYTPEGLDSAPVHLLGQTLTSLDDRQRVALLGATGVDRLLLARPLAAAVGDRAMLLERGDGAPPIHLYALPGSLRDAELVGSVRFAPHVRAGFEALLAPGFDPRAAAVIAGEGAPRERPAGRTRVERFGAGEIAVEVESESGGWLVVRRAWLPIWEVEIAGRRAPVRIANVTRLAVEVPAGRHRVRFFVSRTPFRVALLGSAAGAAALVLLAVRRPRRP